MPALETAGYTLASASPSGSSTGCCAAREEDVNLHVFSAGCPEIERMLRFRDRLRSNAADRERYAAAKRELAARRVARRAGLRGRQDRRDQRDLRPFG